MLNPPDWSQLYAGDTGAIFGHEGEASPYRYTLHRKWSDAAPEVWLMCNPSTATAFELDATIRRVVAFSRAWGAGGAIVGNAYALRSTDPAGLHGPWPAVGLWNDVAIARMFEFARLVPNVSPRRRVMAAWGAVAETGPGWDARLSAIQGIARRAGVDLYALNTTKSGAPVHPLRRPKTEQPTLWGEGHP